MNIPKDGPGTTPGPQTNETASNLEKPGGVPLPGQSGASGSHNPGPGQMAPPQPPQKPSPTLAMPPLSSGVQPASRPNVADEIDDPMARLTEIVAQSAQAEQVPVAPQMPTPNPAAMPLQQPPVAVPQVEVLAEERPAPPAAPVARKRFSLFSRKTAERSAPTVAELTEDQAKKGFFARRAARRAAERVEHGQRQRTSRDKRYARRRRRIWFEELLGWIFVPVIIVAIYYAALGLLALFGMTPAALIQGLKALHLHF